MKLIAKVLYDLAIYTFGMLLVSVSWVLGHSRNHDGETLDQAFMHSRHWLVGFAILLAVVLAMSRPSADP